MANQMTFKRYELKYILTRRQRDRLVQLMAPHMELDQYGHSTIRNIYFDTDSYRLVRNSIGRPEYKEKLRVRSYGRTTPEDPVFVELKKKYKSVVYKRRAQLSEREAMDWLSGDGVLVHSSQILDELEYFRSFYETLHPVVFLSYEREAFFCPQDGDFRVTFDENILSRLEELSLCTEPWGTPLLDREQVLMELKTSQAIPLWMTHVLSELHIYKTSFSKYGEAYRELILKNPQEVRLYA